MAMDALRFIAMAIAMAMALAAASAMSEEAAAAAAAAAHPIPAMRFGRSSFPSGFVFGTASAAYQVEGAANEGGRGPSIWDDFTHNQPEKIADRSNADVAIDFYHRYKEDIGLMKDTGIDGFRLSLSWSRILPKGKISGGINQEGVDFYNNVFNELLSKGIQPYVSIFHWDLPLSLEEEYGGFLSPRLVEDYAAYTDLVFKLYGDRVKNWITFNEPFSYCHNAYSSGTFAPGRCSKFLGCAEGDSSREPYIAAHHLLLAHAAAVKVYRDKYQATQKGVIGITLVTQYFKPYSTSKADMDAATRALDFYFGWFMDPISTGDYPFTMRALVGDRLPRFTPQQSKLLKGSYDFLGLNYYATYYARSMPFMGAKVNGTYDDDMHAPVTGVRNGKLIGVQAGSEWLYIYPQGIRLLVLYIKEKYNNPIIYITENGVDTLTNASIPLQDELQDDIRIRYHLGHLLNLNKAISEGSNVRAYFAWTMFDDFEWDGGFTVRYGLHYVDYKTLERRPKKSAHWYRNFLAK